MENLVFTLEDLIFFTTTIAALIFAVGVYFYLPSENSVEDNI